MKETLTISLNISRNSSLPLLLQYAFQLMRTLTSVFRLTSASNSNSFDSFRKFFTQKSHIAAIAKLTSANTSVDLFEHDLFLFGWYFTHKIKTWSLSPLTKYDLCVFSRSSTENDSSLFFRPFSSMKRTNINNVWYLFFIDEVILKFHWLAQKYTKKN